MVAECLSDSLPQANPDIFDRVVRVHCQVAIDRDGQIEEPVAREERQEMVERANAGVDLGLAGAVDDEL